MSALSDIVSLVITAESSKATAPGFGKALILSYSAAWPGELAREYSELSEVEDDFATTTPEYKAASKYFSQEPRPEKVVIGKGELKPTQRFRVTPTAIHSYTYKLTVNGTEVSYTADSATTVAEIIAGLKAAIDALALGITTSDQTTYLRVLANTAGDFFALGSTDANVRVQQDHADPGVATDLAAIAVVNNTWYGLITLFNSQALVVAAAAWVEANKKIYGAQTEDGNVPNTAISGTDDVAEAIKAANYQKTFVCYSPRTDDFLDAGIIGKCFPYTPGEETWKFKTVAGVTVGAFTSTQRTNMRAKNCNFYEETAGVSMFEEGYTGDGSYIDFVRYMDYLEAMIATGVFGAVSTPAKLPMNDRGIAAVENVIRGQLGSDEAREALLPGWSTQVPKASAITSADRTARILRNVRFTAVYAGAIHKVLINGTVQA